MSRLIRNESGFTIIEVFLVIVIIAILHKMFVPRYSEDTKDKVYSAAHILASDLRYARRLAMGGGLEGNSTATLDSQPAFWLKLSKTGSATDTWQILDENNLPIKSATVLRNLQIMTISTDSVYFNSNGVPFPSGGNYFYVEDSNQKFRWYVSVERGTGQISIHQ